MMRGVSNTEGWLRLAEAVKRRRADRAWTQLDVHVQGGPSIDRIQAIEGARTDGYSSRTITKLERGLQWEPGSVRAILAGGEPTPTETPPSPPDAAEPKPTVENLAARLARLEQATAEQAQANAKQAQQNEELRRMLEEITGREEGGGGEAQSKAI